MDKQITVLFIAYFFPPMGGAGVQRTLKFVKYMPGFNINPIVICASEEGYVSDQTMLREIPQQVDIYRITSRTFLSRLKASKQTGSVSKVGYQNHNRPQNLMRSKPLRWVKNAILKSYGLINYPDDKHAWAGNAYKQACKIIEKQKIDLIISTSPPISAHLVALKLKSRFCIPWIADFRDLWILNPTYQMPWFRKLLDMKLEKRILHEADRIVTLTPGMVEIFRKQISNKTKVELITNGYDEADFQSLEAVAPQKADTVEFIFTGTFYGPTSPQPFLGAVDELFQIAPAYLEKIRIKFIGNISSDFIPFVDYFFEKYPGVLNRQGYMAHREIIQELYNSDILLLVIGGKDRSKTIYTGKIFEYLRVGKPIFFIGPENGDAWNLLESSERGMVASEDDRPAIISNIRQILESQSIACSDELDVTQYERRNLAGKLADAICSVIEGGAIEV
jgi:glycosyltransferase involved in cell wall biosynthesis